MRVSKLKLEEMISNINDQRGVKPYAQHSFILYKDIQGYQIQQFCSNDGSTLSRTIPLSAKETYWFLSGMLVPQHTLSS